MLLELALGGELFSLLQKKAPLPDKEAMFYVSQVVAIFAFMQSQKVVYRDLKPENLLIDDKGYIKMIDFGFAKVLTEKTWTLCGTPEYLAPEIIKNAGHSFEVDWWCSGILSYECLTGVTPFVCDDQMESYRRIIKCQIKFPRNFSDGAKEFMSKLARHRIPGARTTFLRGAGLQISSPPSPPHHPPPPSPHPTPSPLSCPACTPLGPLRCRSHAMLAHPTKCLNTTGGRRPEEALRLPQERPRRHQEPLVVQGPRLEGHGGEEDPSAARAGDQVGDGRLQLRRVRGTSYALPLPPTPLPPLTPHPLTPHPPRPPRPPPRLTPPPSSPSSPSTASRAPHAPDTTRPPSRTLLSTPPALSPLPLTRRLLVRWQDEAILQYTQNNFKKDDPQFIEFSDNWVGK